MSQAPGARPEKTAIGGELIVPALAVAFSVYFFVSVWDLSWEAKANAVTVGVILLALVALQLMRVALRLTSGTASLAIGALLEPRPLLRERFALVFATAAFIFFIPWLGLTLGLFLLTAALMLLLRAGSLGRIALTAAAVSVSAYLLFIALLNTRLPRGPVEQLLSGLF
jgi:hypothetical protein